MGRKKKIKKNYFDELEEQAVIDYSNTECEITKNRIYETLLKEPFRMMTESISKKYPLHLGNYTIEEIQKYAQSHLVEQMVKFNPNKQLKNNNKPKAFSYCQTIVRNFYKLHSKVTYKELKTNLEFDSYYTEIEKSDDYLYEIDERDDDKYIQLMRIMIDKIRSIIDNQTLKNDEIIVGEAIINILENWDILFLEDNVESKYYQTTSKKYAKSKILLMLKEQTRLSTKDIRAAMKPFNDVYFLERDNLMND